METIFKLSVLAVVGFLSMLALRGRQVGRLRLIGFASGWLALVGALASPLDEIAAQMRRLAPGQTLEVRATDPSVGGDLPAWCRLVGHELITRDGDHYLIRRRG